MKLKKSRQLIFSHISGWGGVRVGAGRPNLSGRVNHMERPRVSIKTPLHITMRLKEKLPSLRNKVLFREFKTSVRKASKQGLYVLQFSIQANHIHLLAEANDNRALELGMRSLAGRFAKTIRYLAHTKARSDRRGSVFKGRYHLHVLKTAAEVKNALEYILLNLSRHQKVIEYIDRFSSGIVFNQWKTLLKGRYQSLIKFHHEFYQMNPNDDLLCVLSPPRSWLAKVGWQKAA